MSSRYSNAALWGLARNMSVLARSSAKAAAPMAPAPMDHIPMLKKLGSWRKDISRDWEEGRRYYCSHRTAVIWSLGQGSGWAVNQGARGQGKGSCSIKDGTGQGLLSKDLPLWEPGGLWQTRGGSCPRELTSRSGARQESDSLSCCSLSHAQSCHLLVWWCSSRLHPPALPSLLINACQCLQSRSHSSHLPGEGAASHVIRLLKSVSPLVVTLYFLLAVNPSDTERPVLLFHPTPNSAQQGLTQGRQAIWVHFSQLRRPLFSAHYTNKTGSKWKQANNKKGALHKTIVDNKANVL